MKKIFKMNNRFAQIQQRATKMIKIKKINKNDKQTKNNKFTEIKININSFEEFF